MPGLLEVIDAGIGNSIQDGGRFGFRHMGITASGCLDALLARCANALVGNAPDADCACIEMRAVGPKLQVTSGPVRIALAGDISATLYAAGGGSCGVAAWCSVTLVTGDVLALATLSGGVAYLAFAGGIDSPLQLGSRSTYERALIGGIGGCAIAVGNRLPCRLVARAQGENQAPRWSLEGGPLRVMPGPQNDHFKREALAVFLGSDYVVTPQRDRMGMRLEGAPLAHVSAAAADIVSDGVTPGAIQVPGNGQPIILLADCQTVGGYPKIATVIRADLPRLAQLHSGQSLRFAAVSSDQARQALLEREAQWQAWARRIVAVAPDTTAPDEPIISSNW